MSDDWQTLRELKELIAWARDPGATTMTLWVTEGNEPALGNSLGYRW